MKNDIEYKVIGMMSGTSLDGLDLAGCTFKKTGSSWDWSILASETIPYPPAWKGRLQASMGVSGEVLSRTHIELGAYFSECLKSFMAAHDFYPDLICSHGHTVFHQPGHRLTLQIGAGTEIFAATGIPVVCDFRTLDLALGGQGAPLVPIGDRWLFGEYDACLNLGGIANISFESEGRRVAYDICPCNMTLNWLAARLDLDFDRDGEIAASGKVVRELLTQLNGFDYYAQHPPKSLGMEQVESGIFPLLSGDNTADMLRTAIQHTAEQIVQAIHRIDKDQPRILVTGGGAFNPLLVKVMRELLGDRGGIMIPDAKIIAFKEALVFAFLGVLRLRNEINVLSSVTGARADSSSGVVYGSV